MPPKTNIFSGKETVQSSLTNPQNPIHLEIKNDDRLRSKRYLQKYCIMASIKLSSLSFPRKCFLLSNSIVAKYGHLTGLLIVSACNFWIKADALDIRLSNCTQIVKHIKGSKRLLYGKHWPTDKLKVKIHLFICQVWNLAINKFGGTYWIVHSLITPNTVIFQQAAKIIE